MVRRMALQLQLTEICGGLLEHWLPHSFPGLQAGAIVSRGRVRLDNAAVGFLPIPVPIELAAINLANPDRLELHVLLLCNELQQAQDQDSRLHLIHVSVARCQDVLQQP